MKMQTGRSEINVGDYVMTTFDVWKEKGFNHPKRVHAIKRSNYFLLDDNGGRFDACHISHLRLATAEEMQTFKQSGKHLFCNFSISKLRQKFVNGFIQIWHDEFFVNYCQN